MNNFEKIEAYFNNELTDSEKNDFLEEVESDANLKSEYNFQNEVVNGIKEARKAELKAMLNKVTIASTSSVGTGLYKMVAGGAAIVLVGTSIWYYSNSETKINTDEERSNIIATILPKTEEGETEAKTEIATPSKTENSDIKSNSEPKSASSSIPKIITPNLPSSNDELANETLPEENLEIPEAMNNSAINLSSKINVEIKLKKKYNFHYQYSAKGIVLYGDFEEGLFEILELNKEDNIELYLFYKSNYYYINNDSGVITPLKSVVNKNLKIKLEGLR